MMRNIHIKIQSVSHHDLEISASGKGPTAGQYIDDKVEDNARNGLFANKVVVEFDPPPADLPNRCD